ncbi:MAG: prepilin peptidase [Pirellulales bacterium]|nr:prepilin peptidase [Pirellulales bacterium]
MDYFATLPPTLKWIYALWLAAVGGCVGSFLNVVVYRVPAGLSLIRPGSHCPACKHPIRWHDNVPVFGWILLRGRCRDCQAWISPRYPLVEALTAGVFFALAWVELLSGGANLPLRAVALGKALAATSLTAAELVGVFSYHLLFLSTLLAVALVAYDGHRLWPRASLGVGIVAAMIWPRLHPVALWPGWDDPLVGLIEAGLGLAVGVTIGLVLDRLFVPRGSPGVVSAAGCVGVFLGIQTVVWLSVPLLVILIVQWPFTRRHSSGSMVPPAVGMAALAFGWLLAWNSLANLWPF